MRDILLQYRLFQDISPGDLMILTRASLPKEAKKGDFVCREGEEISSLLLLNSGKVKLVQHTFSGKDVILDIATSGEILMLEPLFDEGMCPASAIAVENSTVIHVDKRTLLLIMEKNPRMMRYALRQLALRTRTLSNLVKDLSVGKVDNRIASVMLKLGEKIGQTEGEGVIRMPISLSRQDIADLSGTTIETAIRTMSKLSREEVLKTTKDTIYILDRDRLLDIAAGF